MTSIRNRVPRYEQAAIVGVLLTVLGSTGSWFDVEATASAAEQADNLEPGTNTMTGTAIGWGQFTLFLGVVAAVVLGLVLWRYRSPGRKTGLVVMLAGLLNLLIAVAGVALTGIVLGVANGVQGVTVGFGSGILLTLVGSVVLLSAGILRLAAGAPPGAEAPTEDRPEESGEPATDAA